MNLCKFWLFYKMYKTILGYLIKFIKFIKHRLDIYIYIMCKFTIELKNLYEYFNMNVINLHYFLSLRMKLK